MATVQNCIIFKTTVFNTSIRREYFINPSCYGDDAARWLITELTARGIATNKTPGQEDFGWHFRFHAGGADHNLVIGFRPGCYGGDGEWICWVERKTGLAGAALGMQKDIKPAAVKIIQDILVASPTVTILKFCELKDM